MSAAIEMAPGVFRIPTMGDYINTIAFVEDDGSVTLVDCGVKKAPPKIVAGLAAMGKAPADVQKIVPRRHAHNDHAGARRKKMVRRTGVEGVEVHSEDAEFVEAGSCAARRIDGQWPRAPSAFPLVGSRLCR